HYLVLEDEIADVVECSHLLEHLGIAQAIYSISEFFRVLRPGGSLLIATPDIESTFKQFLESGEQKRKYLMNWIYGLDQPGMNHRYAFPPDLLNRLLDEAGFENIRIGKFGTDSIHPEIRVKAQKPKSSPAKQMIAQFRRDLIHGNVVDLEDQIMALGLEECIELIVSNLERILQNETWAHFLELLAEVCVCSPATAYALLDNLRSNEYFSDVLLDPIGEVVLKLDELGFPQILMYMIEKYPVEDMTTSEVFGAVRDLGIKSVMKVFSQEKSKNTLRSLEQTKNDVRIPLEIDVFSSDIPALLARKLVSMGTHEFANDLLVDSAVSFGRAVRFDRDSLLAQWNLARVLYLTDEPLFVEAYDRCRILAGNYPRSQEKTINELLDKDLESIQADNSEKINQPIYRIKS
ncbi:MAG: hypothetical protein P1Q69_17015, partial [Candidatus Thorarchaeota archaeon]|nr:hypothetical protein [Candidatus Thorarchaeota archaeon]